MSTFQHLMGESAAFRSFVMDDDTRLMSDLLTLTDEVAFAPLTQRLAQRLLADADPRGVAAATHQKLADGVGSVREVVSRLVGQWFETGLIELRRGRNRDR
ncbi:helix-turn-helix domain-containing protein [Methylobacterium sp. J-030]|uniref:helix-turn-helix domain-containing protein n=1 Tax=Methylobacterium sp. J-030 TaxID=2836627 RepID=UPI001FBA30A6|nr:helix-turn-helix domain-containing protein [Methylobacterium sp. J-030]MCJ2071733.1 helix-turn-helix domain-containing protein [Methylobacterium sp. J-030]